MRAQKAQLFGGAGVHVFVEPAADPRAALLVSRGGDLGLVGGRWFADSRARVGGLDHSPAARSPVIRGGGARRGRLAATRERERARQQQRADRSVLEQGSPHPSTVSHGARGGPRMARAMKIRASLLRVVVLVLDRRGQLLGCGRQRLAQPVCVLQ